MAMTLEQKRQLAIQSLKAKMINKMKKIKSSDDTIENVLYNVSDEAEKNLLRIFDYCHRQFEYQCKYFELDNTIFVPNIYCNKNKCFYILNFIDQYRDRKQKIINEFINSYPDIRIKRISLKQYRRILKWFQDDLLFTVNKYKVNFSANNRVRLKCLYCGKKFFSKNKKDKYCSEECAINAHNNKTNKSILRHYYSGYYMDIHHFVRSGWEHNIARILQWCELDYDYECYTFKLSNGSIYTPDFYVYVDNTYYEIKGEMRTNTLAKYNMFKEEYSDKKLIIINGEIYKALLEQFPNINFSKHIDAYHITDKNLNNIYKYRHDKILYENWELDYIFYTNERIFDTKNSKLFTTSIQELSKELNINIKQIYSLIKNGKITYIYYNEQYLFNLELAKRQLEKNTIDILHLNNAYIALNKKDLFFNHTNADWSKNLELISSEADKNIIKIIQYLKLDCYYEHTVIDLDENETIASKIFTPLDKYYYFCKFDYNPSMQNKLVHKLSTLEGNYKIISKIEYRELLKQFDFLFNKKAKETKVFTKQIFCEHCGKQIDPKLIKPSYIPKFCSQKCHYQHTQNTKATTTRCLNCNVDIKIKNEREKLYHQFCSEKCALEYKEKMNKNLVMPVAKNNLKGIERIIKLKFYEQYCKHCQKKFYYVSNHTHKFCSEECRLQNSAENVQYTYTCKYCNKVFITNNKRQKYCSIKCNHESMKQSRGNLLKINTELQDKLLNITITNELEIQEKISNSLEQQLIKLLLMNLGGKIKYRHKLLELSNGTLIMSQIYCCNNDTYYFLKQTEKHQREKINQFIKENENMNITLVDIKIFNIALQTHKLVRLNDPNYYSYEEAKRLVNPQYTDVLFQQFLRRHNINFYIDEFLQNKLILKNDLSSFI